MIHIAEHPIEYYVDRLRSRDYFTLLGYSDAEWFCVLNHDTGRRTGFGQMLTKESGLKLIDVLKRTNGDPRVLTAVPKCMWEWDDFVSAEIGRRIEKVLKYHKLRPQLVERDMILDDLAAAAGLYPFINQLQSMRVVVIGNHALRGLDFLGYDLFIGIDSPDFHLQPKGIKRVTALAKHYGQPAVYLVSAGISAAFIIDRLHNQIPDSFFIDCGSIWDAFVGIGGQRSWRSRLYENPQALEEWKHANLYGKP